jgi:hypothetical protein
MGIQYIPGPEAILNPAFQQIAAGAQQLIDPDREFRKAMQMAVASNPQLLQTLADISKKAPGVLQSLGLGKNLSATIGNVPESTQSQIDRATSGNVVETAKTTAKTAQVQSGMSLQQAMEMADLLKNEPGLSREAAYAKVMGQTRAATESEQIGLEANKMKLAAMKKVQAMNLTAEELLERNKGLTARDILDGKLNFKDLTTLFGSEYGDAIKPFVDWELRKRQMDLEHSRLLIRSRQDADEWYKQHKFTIAANRQMTTDVGRIEDWQNYLFDPNTRKKAIELSKKDYASLSEDEKGIVDIYKAEVREGQYRMTQQTSRLAQEVNRNTSVIREMKIKGEKPEAIEPKVYLLNKILEDAGSPYTVSYEKVKRGWFGSNEELVYRDRNKNIVPAAEAEGDPLGVEAPRTRSEFPPDLSSKIDEGERRLRSLSPGARLAAVEDLAATAKSDADKAFAKIMREKVKQLNEVEVRKNRENESTATRINPAMK